MSRESIAGNTSYTLNDDEIELIVCFYENTFNENINWEVFVESTQKPSYIF